MSDTPLPQLTKDDLEELLNTKVDSFTVSRLTAPGENYGSTMLQVEVVLLPDHKKLSIVAKMASESPNMREVFRFRETVPKEICTYLLVRPEILAIQEEHGVAEELFLDIIPECYGARTTRGGGTDQPVDETSAILLENLKVSGYRLADRLVGLDLKHLEYAVTRLARFHATVVVIKLKKPDVFKDTVMKAAAHVKGDPLSDEKCYGPRNQVLTSVAHLPIVNQYMDKIKGAMERKHEHGNNEEPQKPREPFATFVHRDFWTNNMMFSHGGRDGENITGLKIFDFQMPSYGSPATDLLFLIYSSRALDVTKEDCDRLIKLYYDEFINWLELLGCDADPFSYELFLKEIDSEVKESFAHAFYMLKIISMPQNNAPDISDRSSVLGVFGSIAGLGETYFTKVQNLVKEFVERNWL